ncbi:MAG: peptide chain release factor N(5)-glutamine methyltransferase [Clostridiales bacterium]|nr:peptide chain release factor N(5)-glutamine methyltransferase [Clostridiales bacterium]
MEEKKQKDNAYDTSKKTCRTLIGGQALMEGVMMRGKTSMAMAVRAPDGEIELETERLKKPSKARKIPLVRGIFVFVDSLTVGMRTLLKSSEVSAPEEEQLSKTSTAIAVILGVILAIGLFIAAPWFVGWSIKNWGHYDNVAVVSIIEGATRIIIFVSYLALVRLMKDIKRTFMYHGAEHRTINCFERGLPLTVENVQSCSTKHNRCGTTFLFFVVVLAIIVYALLNWLFSFLSQYTSLFDNFFFTLLIRLLFLPLLAGLSYELLRGLAMLPDNAFTNAIRAPGLLLQKLTTCIPDDEMAEVAIAAFNAVLELDGDENKPTIEFYEREFADERKKLAERLPDNPQDADWIYCELLDKKRGELSGVKRVKIGIVKTANEYADRLLAGEPLDYILGNSDFCGVKIKVDKRVLIPRFETEVLANAAVERIGGGAPAVLDLCTGSGCIAAVIARNTQSAVTASDVSPEALEVAAENLKGLGVELVQSDMFDGIDGKFDIIVSNPPYVKTFEIDTLAPQVTAQPRKALDGGEDGLHFYRIIAEKAHAYLNDGGVIMAEVGYDQAQDVIALFNGIGKCSIIKDLDGKDRIVVCEK